MPSPHRRAKRYLASLTPEEDLYLATGTGDPFPDDAAALAAWERFYADISVAPGLVPWAAIRFDGVQGHSSPYCHLGAPNCHPEPA